GRGDPPGRRPPVGGGRGGRRLVCVGHGRSAPRGPCHALLASRSGDARGGAGGGDPSPRRFHRRLLGLAAAVGGSRARRRRARGAVLFSVVFVTFTLYRAPLTLIYSLQSRILPYLVSMGEEGDESGLRRVALRVLVPGGILTALGALVGWLVGPQVVALPFGE